MALRDARIAAIEELERAQTRYSAGGPAMRPVSLPALRQARQRYAETSVAILDFLDARDRRSIARLQADADRLQRVLEERARARAEIEKILRPE